MQSAAIETASAGTKPAFTAASAFEKNYDTETSYGKLGLEELIELIYEQLHDGEDIPLDKRTKLQHILEWVVWIGSLPSCSAPLLELCQLCFNRVTSCRIFAHFIIFQGYFKGWGESKSLLGLFCEFTRYASWCLLSFDFFEQGIWHLIKWLEALCTHRSSQEL